MAFGFILVVGSSGFLPADGGRATGYCGACEENYIHPFLLNSMDDAGTRDALYVACALGVKEIEEWPHDALAILIVALPTLEHCSL